MGMILRIASSRIVGQGDIVGRSGYFSLNLSANSVMRGRLDARRTLKSLVADLRYIRIFSQLLVNRFFVVSIACKTSPINHHTGRTFQQSYHICLRFISEFIFLEISHILIGNKMNTACIGRYGCCKFSRLFPWEVIVAGVVVINNP